MKNMEKREENGLLIGWYSPQAAIEFGSVIYRSIDGSEVEVTAVFTEDWDRIANPNYEWKDVIKVGYVTEYIRKGRRGDYESFPSQSYWKPKDSDSILPYHADLVEFVKFQVRDTKDRTKEELHKLYEAIQNPFGDSVSIDKEETEEK